MSPFFKIAGSPKNQAFLGEIWKIGGLNGTCGVHTSGCDVVLPTKPLIPNLRELVNRGFDFSESANVTVRFRTDTQKWEVLAGESSWVKVYIGRAQASLAVRCVLPVTGGAFAISLLGNLPSSAGEN